MISCTSNAWADGNQPYPPSSSQKVETKFQLISDPNIWFNVYSEAELESKRIDWFRKFDYVLAS